jgi:hypothetical protein
MSDVPWDRQAALKRTAATDALDDMLACLDRSDELFDVVKAAQASSDTLRLWPDDGSLYTAAVVELAAQVGAVAMLDPSRERLAKMREAHRKFLEL